MHQSNNADIEYLVSMFDQELDLMKDYASKPDIDPVSRAYINSFISHAEHTRHTQNIDVTDFIDYGTKLMAYLSKNGIKGIKISPTACNNIMDLLIDRALLREPIIEAIQRKTKNNGNKQDIEALISALNELDCQPIDYDKFREKLAKVTEL